MSTFQSVSSTQHSVSYCNLRNSTAISAIQLQSQQSNCNLRNPTAISTINDKILPWLTPRCPHSRVCQAPSTVFHTAISAIQLQSPQSNCNLRNLTAIPAIRLQSQQSDCNLHNQTAIFTINEQILPCRTYRGPHSRVCQAPSALFQTAISTIRLQYQQS